MTTACPPHPDQQSAPRVHFALVVFALAMGGFAIGVTEFVTMGLLPEIAAGVSESIPTTGHVISAYALGVVVGAPVLAFLGATWSRKPLLLALMGAFVVGNAASALAGSYATLAVARFVAGLPHGAYFGVASLVAAHLAPAGRKGRAVAGVMMGLSVANVVGVPAATWLGQTLGWRAAFWMVVVLGGLTALLVARFIPAMERPRTHSGLAELRAFTHGQVWLTLLAGAVGFGGMFAVYTYISPMLTRVGGLERGAVPVFLFVFGLGMVFGTWWAGRMADWSVVRSLLIGAASMAVVLVVFWLLVPYGWVALPVVFAITTAGSLLVVNLQLRLMEVAGEAQTLGAAMNHASLNVANALGAWIGGVVIAAGYGYRSPILAGVALALAGLAVIGVSATMHRSANRSANLSGGRSATDSDTDRAL